MKINFLILNLSANESIQWRAIDCIVLDKTVKGICSVQLYNQKVLCAPGPRTKLFKHFFVVQ